MLSEKQHWSNKAFIEKKPKLNTTKCQKDFENFISGGTHQKGKLKEDIRRPVKRTVVRSFFDDSSDEDEVHINAERK